jgi:hypothetical protein
MSEPDLKLKPGIKMDEDTAVQVAKIACALKALSLYTTLVIPREDCPEEIARSVEDGTAAMQKLFTW